MNILFIITTICVLVGCNRTNTASHVELTHQLTEKFSKDLEKYEHVKLIGSGGQLREGVHVISLDCLSNRRTKISDARNSLVLYVTKFLILINQDAKLRPYLDHYPFTINGIDFTINFSDKNNREFTDGSVAYVSVFFDKRIHKSLVIYKIFDPIKKEFVEVHRETYEEAERIVRMRE